MRASLTGSVANATPPPIASATPPDDELPLRSLLNSASLGLRVLGRSVLLRLRLKADMSRLVFLQLSEQRAGRMRRTRRRYSGFFRSTVSPFHRLARRPRGRLCQP